MYVAFVAYLTKVAVQRAKCQATDVHSVRSYQLLRSQLCLILFFWTSSLGRVQSHIPYALSLQMAWDGFVKASVSNGPQNMGYAYTRLLIILGGSRAYL